MDIINLTQKIFNIDSVLNIFLLKYKMQLYDFFEEEFKWKDLQPY